jgi:hypothetical protein
MEWVTKTSRADSRAAWGSSARAPRVASTTGSTNPGWLKYWRSRSRRGASSTSATASARFSRYCRQLEYDEYAEVVSTAARRTPSATIPRSVSAR